MSRQTDQIPNLAFSHKYGKLHSQRYYAKHTSSLARKLSNWREQSVARKALRLAGNPESVLDLPCGAGRFWPLLSEAPERKLLVTDNSIDMLQVALAHMDESLYGRVQCFQSSGFAVPLPDNSVDCVFCVRLLHHLGKSSDRLIFLRELARIADSSVIISLWIDGNIKAWRRRRVDRRREAKYLRHYQNRFIIPHHQAEHEFNEVGLTKIGQVDFLKYYSMWRFYVLRP